MTKLKHFYVRTGIRGNAAVLFQQHMENSNEKREHISLQNITGWVYIYTNIFRINA